MKPTQRHTHSLSRQPIVALPKSQFPAHLQNHSLKNLQYRERLLVASVPSKTRNSVLNLGSCGLNAPPARCSSIENATNPLNRKWSGMKSRLRGLNIPVLLVELWKWFYFRTCFLGTGIFMRNTTGAFVIDKHYMGHMSQGHEGYHPWIY